jgi:hypothetical protein
MVAERVYPHFAQHLASAPMNGPRTASLPDQETIATIVDAGFWASLRREEGVSPLISLAFLAREQTPQPLIFEQSLPLAPHSLTRLAPAVERPGVHLGVWPEQGQLRVWGATRQLPPMCFVLEVFAPGLLVLKQSPLEESGKFINVAVLQGDELKVIDERSTSVPDCPELLNSLVGFQTQIRSGGDVNVLIQLTVSMRAHGRGGTLLVVASDSNTWQESILQPVLYAVVPPFAGLMELMQIDSRERPKRRWQDALRHAIDGIAGLTAVDGATIITEDYSVLGFGAKIVRRKGHVQVSQVIRTEPIEGNTPEILDPTQLGGTRHLSAAQFVQDQRNAIALVASQDGRFTVFAWSPCENMVHAHQIETLLL